ncbi:MAG: bifunctional phosphoribosylaminoimidazolecarboxamide formyltransferase/IMP cyclohydrolase, partial [Bacteroides sp.]
IQLHGKALSYNNLLDVEAGLGLLQEFSTPTFVVIKHGTPCGVATDVSSLQAWKKAYDGDTESVFGGIILSNTTIDEELAMELSALFFEVLIAESYSQEALQVLGQKKNRILLKFSSAQQSKTILRTALNGILVQERDCQNIQELEVVTEAKVYTQADVLFANQIVKHCKSNAIVIAKSGQLIGTGAGQTSRVDAVRQAIAKAQRFGFEQDLKGATLASDAFFPFPDSVEIAAAAGISCLVQPGGSLRDQEVIAKCNQLGITMLFTGIRHFKH